MVAVNQGRAHDFLKEVGDELAQSTCSEKNGVNSEISYLEKVESWATLLPAQSNSYLHMQNFDTCMQRMHYYNTE